MTNIEALKMLKAKRECILKEIDPSGGCDDEKCDGCDLNYEQGRMGEQAEALHIAIESLEAWEKVKEELKESSYERYFEFGEYIGEDTQKVRIISFDTAMSIIDNHLSEVSE